MLSGLQSYLKLKGKHQHLNNNPLDTGGILLSLDRPIITNEQSSRTVGSRTIKRKNFRRIRAENMGWVKQDVLYGQKEKNARQYNKYRKKEDHYLDEIDCDNDITVDRGMVLRNEEPPETISPENFKHIVHENGSIQQLGRWTRETRRLCLETFILGPCDFEIVHTLLSVMLTVATQRVIRMRRRAGCSSRISVRI